MGVNKKDTPNQSLTEFVLMRLRADIVCGVFAPATKLNIESLKKRYEVGGTPIREALNQLVPQGLVAALPLKGFWVTALSLTAAQDLYATRRYLEKEMIRLALHASSDDWEAQCLANLHRIKRCLQKDSFIETPDVTQWSALNAAFWQDCFLVGESDYLRDCHQRLCLSAERYEYFLYAQSDSALTLMQQHHQRMVAFFDCCLEANVEAADQQHAQYLELILHAITQSWQETE